MIHQHNTNRATAYNHEKPYERAAGFIEQSIYICDQNIERLKTEIKMWGETEVVMILGADECEGRRTQAESVLQNAEIEKANWATLYAKLGACPACAGGGWLWRCVSQDESIKVKCDACGGAGKSLKAQAAVATVNAKILTEKAEAEGTKAGNFLTMVARKFK